MKILQINSVCGYGSTGRITADIYKASEDLGYECLIAYGRGTAPIGINSVRIGTIFDNCLHAAKTRLLDKHGLGSAKATKEFIKKAREYNPDLIHLHNIHGYYINIQLLFDYLKGTNKPVVWTLHDCWPFTGHCAHFDYIGCNKWKIACFECPLKSSYPSSIIIDNSKNNYEIKKRLFTGINSMAIVTPSMWLAGLAGESFLKEYKIMVINNGIDLNVFRPTESNFRQKKNLNGKFMILGVANVWNEWKGLTNFIELSKHIGSDSKIVLVGLDSRQLKALSKNIIGLKRTESVNELAKIYSAADVFVNPALEDNFPTTNLEALACGTPVITFDTGGSAECMAEGSGAIVKKGDMDGLISSINAIRMSPPDKNNCILQAKKFNKEDRFLDYMKIYEHLYSGERK